MGKIRIVSCGDFDFTKSSLLHYLSLLEPDFSSENKAGIYIVMSDNHITKYKRVVTDFENTPKPDDVFLVYKELNEFEASVVKKHKDCNQVYILAHKMLDLEKFKDSVYLDSIIVLADSEHIFLKTYKQLPDYFFHFKKDYFLLYGDLKKNGQANYKHIPFFILNILKVFVNPFDEIYAMIQSYSGKLINRFIELLMYLLFVVKQIYYIGLRISRVIFYPFYKTYWFVEYQYYKRIKKTILNEK